MAWPRAREGLGTLRERFGGHAVRPFGVVAVLDAHAHGGAQRVTVSDAARERDAVVLDLHATTPPVSALPPREIAVDVLADERQARDDAIDDRREPRPVRFAR